MGFVNETNRQSVVKTMNFTLEGEEEEEGEREKESGYTRQVGRVFIEGGGGGAGRASRH